jgi:hypothetical protein
MLVQQWVTPGAVELVIETSGMSAEPSTASMRPDASENSQIRLLNPRFGLLALTAAVRATRMSCRNAGKVQKFALVRGSYGNPGEKQISLSPIFCGRIANE